MSLRQNDQELASLYDQVILNIWISDFHILVRCFPAIYSSFPQNHIDNHKSSMVGQMVVASLVQGDKISVKIQFQIEIKLFEHGRF